MLCVACVSLERHESVKVAMAAVPSSEVTLVASAPELLSRWRLAGSDCRCPAGKQSENLCRCT